MERKTVRHIIVDSIREIVFGLEDALVSTLGAITGIAVGTQSQYVVILSGLVLIAAESMSMGAGSYLSSKSAAYAEDALHQTKSGEKTRPVRAGIVMWVFYFIGGFVPLAPYFFLEPLEAIVPSVIFTATTLFILGAWAAGYTKRSKMRSGLEMMGVSLAAAFVGYAIGRIAVMYFGV